MVHTGEREHFRNAISTVILLWSECLQLLLRGKDEGRTLVEFSLKTLLSFIREEIFLQIRKIDFIQIFDFKVM